MKETEAKFPLSSTQYNEIKDYLFRLTSYKKYTLSKGKNLIIDSSYYDTTDRTLIKERCMLRIIKKDGDNILSFKKREGQRLNVVMRTSYSALVNNIDINKSDIEPIQKAREIIGDVILREVSKIRTVRDIIYFKCDTFFCEVRLDNVVVLEPRSDHFHELEFDLKKGDFESFRELLEQIHNDFGVGLSRQSKFERALEIPEESL